MTDKVVIALTGTSGELGRRIAEQLSERGEQTLLVGRTPSKLPELPGAERRGPAAYGDFEAMKIALQGASTLMLISGNLSGRRLEEHSIAMDAAIAAGVTRILYVSMVGAAEDAVYSNARDHGQTENYLKSLPVKWSIIRAGFFASWLPRLVENGLIKGPAGDGRVAAVSHDDIARVTVAVLLDDTGRYDGETLDVTGPEAVGLAEVAELFTLLTGEEHRYETETHEEAIASRADIDELPVRKEGWITWYLAVAHGDVELVTDVVPRITGRPAMTITETLQAQFPGKYRG